MTTREPSSETEHVGQRPSRLDRLLHPGYVSNAAASHWRCFRWFVGDLPTPGGGTLGEDVYEAHEWLRQTWLRVTGRPE